MSDFIQRLKEEQLQVQQRWKKLIDFMATEKFHPLPQEQKTLMRLQLNAMSSYIICLTERLSLLEETK